MATDPLDRIAAVYARFAMREARGRSVLYEELATRVAGDRDILRLLVELPGPKQQPNLLLASVRFLLGTPSNWPQFRGWVLERWDEIVAVMLVRRTQTNEPARCATLLPLLATLAPPLAVLEVGAAAGLCLLPDRYGYDYNGHNVPPSRPAPVIAPTFACRANPATPLPARGLEVAWRAGLDLEPLDVRNREQTDWLEALVWPGEGNRLALLRAALDVARLDPPPVTRGDLRNDLPALAAQAPRDATLVVFHTAVLAYLPDPADRAGFAQTVNGLDAIWLANEAPGTLTTAQRPKHPRPSGCDLFLLTSDRQPIAWTDPHGTSLDWLS